VVYAREMSSEVWMWIISIPVFLMVMCLSVLYKRQKRRDAILAQANSASGNYVTLYTCVFFVASFESPDFETFWWIIGIPMLLFGTCMLACTIRRRAHLQAVQARCAQGRVNRWYRRGVLKLG
jgi:formate-dependent nitrite reductase membrane component NrfD